MALPNTPTNRLIEYRTQIEVIIQGLEDYLLRHPRLIDTVRNVFLDLQRADREVQGILQRLEAAGKR